jgi:hypothetical protein
MSSPGAGLPQGRPQLKFFGKNYQNQEFFYGKTPKPKKTGARTKNKRNY